MVNDSAAVVFDDERAVANAGVMLPAALAAKLGIEPLVEECLDLGEGSGTANPGRKVMTPLSAMALGGLHRGLRGAAPEPDRPSSFPTGATSPSSPTAPSPWRSSRQSTPATPWSSWRSATSRIRRSPTSPRASSTPTPPGRRSPPSPGALDGLLGLPGATVRAARTLRRRLLALPGRLTRTARRFTLHSPARWPWREAFIEALERIRVLRRRNSRLVAC